MTTNATQVAGSAYSWKPAAPATLLAPRWTAAFVGLLFYTFTEYMRLPEMYPVLAVLKLGRVAIILTAVGYLFGSRFKGLGNRHLRSFDITMSVFIFGNFMSACLSPEQGNVWSEFQNILEWAVLYFLITRILISSWGVRIFVFLVLLLNLKMAQFTVRDYRTERAIGISDMQIIMRGGAGAGSKAYFGNAADLGLAMVVVWGISFALLFGKTEKKKLPRAFLIICFGLFLLAILFCGSRGAVVGAGAVMAVAVGRTPKKIGTIAMALLFLCCLWFVLPDASKERFQNAWEGNDQNAASRLRFWGVGMQMFSDYPVFGVGPGNFGPMYVTKYGGEAAWVAHSVYIQTIAESGLVGAVTLVTFLFLFFRLNRRTRKVALASLGPAGKRTFEYCLAVGLDLALVGYLASGAFLSVLYYPHLWILLGLSGATYTACINRQPQEKKVESRVRQKEFSLASS